MVGTVNGCIFVEYLGLRSVGSLVAESESLVLGLETQAGSVPEGALKGGGFSLGYVRLGASPAALGPNDGNRSNGQSRK